MPVVLVHGNPETAAIWGPLLDALRSHGVDEIHTCAPPGFGAPTPPGWSATAEAYRGWLIDQLDALGGDVDVLGHDWGAIHVLGVLARRPDLFRSWATDCAGLVHPDYEWHDAAIAWQTPEVGEELVAAMIDAPVEERTALFTGLGMTEAIAAEIARALDRETGRCILELYRSATQPALAELGATLRSRALPPGLVVIPTDDPYAGTPAMAAESAAAFGAATITLDGRGHWWMMHDPGTVAVALAEHWGRAASAAASR